MLGDMVESDDSYMAEKGGKFGKEADVTICLEVVDFGLIFLRGGAGLARELTKLARKMYGFAPDN